MAADPRKLRPTDLMRLLNSTPLGTVTTERQIRSHRNRAGFRIGDEKHVDLFRYAAWLMWLRHGPSKSSQDYEARKERERDRAARQSASGRDIGDIPSVADLNRKQRAETDFRFFCESYFPQIFSLSWSDDHLKIIAKIEQAVLHGGLFAMAMPRGSGKTTLAEIACIWAMLTGAREFVCLIGSDTGHARSMLDSIKTEFETNGQLLEDYPEAVFPIRALERIHNRAQGQLCKGKHTRITWTADEIVLPTIPGSKASGAIIRVAGLESRIRGMKFKRADGRAVRPSLVVLDDPQTDESARSAPQIKNRMKTLNGAILNLAGPGKKISGIMPCTVIQPDDMADQILDRDKYPQWQGERTKMVYAFPTSKKLWDRYTQIRADSFRRDGDGHEATEFYCDHRSDMDEGAVVAWPHRYNNDELSAIQHAMNLKIQDEQAFWAEYQNEPLPEGQADSDQLKADQVVEKINGRPRGQVPQVATHITGFIDVHDKLLFWCICAWEDDFTGYIIDYGMFPDQKRLHFTLRDARRTLGRLYSRAGKEGAIYSGLEKLTTDLLARQWKRTDGALLQIERLLIDSGYLSAVVNTVRVKVGQNVMLSKGIGIRAGRKPMASYRRKPGERHGWNWYIPNINRSREFRHIAFDANSWKTFVHDRLATTVGDRGSLTLFGKKPEEHRLFAEHITEAETYVVTQGHGRTVHEWGLKPSAPDNHWLDCLVGCAVAASYQGVTLGGISFGSKLREKPLRLSQIQRRKHSGQIVR